MASLEDIAALRELINEPDDANGWTDERIGTLIDGSTTLNAAASHVWTLKAGQYSAIVDVSESGSSRKLGDMYKNALAMASMYKGLSEAETPPVSTDRPVVQRIRRSFA